MTTPPMMNPVCLKLIQAIVMVCLVLQVHLVCAKEVVRCKQSERQALLHFKAGLVDDYGMLSSWTTADCCQWKGVRCSNLTGHVLMLDLHGQSLWRESENDSVFYISGEIHKSLMELQQLKYLNLSGNSFEDSHIPDFFGSLSNLRYLDLSHSSFVGKIPNQFGSLSHLKYLNLGGNLLDGSIPYQLRNLSNLQFLDLSDNSLEGNIPFQLGNLSKLEHLDLKGNSLIGSIPSQLGDLSNLQNLGLMENSLQGNIPSQLGNLSNLQYLGLSYNSLKGNIPSQLGKLSNLQELYLGGHDSPLKIDDRNRNGGQWMSNLTSLTHLYLWSMPNLNRSHSWLQIICKLPKLIELSLYDCSLSDHFILSLSHSKFNFSTSISVLDLSLNTFTSSLIFQWVSNISSNLVELNLHHNLLEAPASNDFGIMMNSLMWLDLSYNSLKGGVLKSFMNICTLRTLNMNRNNLTEDLPSILHNLSGGCVRNSLKEMDLRNNIITGSLPDLSIFSSLKTLYLSNNQLNGKMTEGSLPSQLESLWIISNSFKGGIPKSFGNACALRSLKLSNNSFSEELPMIIHHLSGCARFSLQELDLSMNQINGTLPNLSIFPSLKRLYLYENRLNGKIPEDIRFPTQLEVLDMSSNSLDGVISDNHFANMSMLKSLVLSDNALTLTFTQNWVPPFQLGIIELRSCKLGLTFPKWLQTQDNFQSLDISNVGISDVVPEWFWAKLALREWLTIDISHNNLKGIIPNFLAKNPYYSLSLASNQFEGPIPPFLRGAQILDLSKNKFSDSHLLLCANGIDETLYQLDLSHNQIYGQIPDCWSHFKSLSYLDLSHNNFSGRIPTSMGLLVELQALLLRNNNLTEEIPLSLVSCTMLVMLDAGENRLSGFIPSWIGSKLQELQVLSLGRNHFFGSLPLELCYLKSIQLLDLSLNNLSGQIPKCFKNFISMAQKTSSTNFSDHLYNVEYKFGNLSLSYDLNALLMWKGVEQMFKNDELSLLKSIDLSSNHFSGEIPVEIDHLFGLVSLNLSRNNLTGEITSNIGKLTSLEFLDLSRNHLIGSIPSSLTQIDRLAMLDLSHNNLSGEIPLSTQLQSFNASSYEDNLDLCGPPLEKLCIEGEPPHEPIVKSQEDEDSLLTPGFYMSMAFGFVIGFWGIFGSILIKHSWRHAYFKFLNS